jgi:hypothetical protein
MYAVLALVALMLLTWAAAIAATFDEEENGQPHQPEEDPAAAQDRDGRPDEDR